MLFPLNISQFAAISSVSEVTKMLIASKLSGSRESLAYMANDKNAIIIIYIFGKGQAIFNVPHQLILFPIQD